jgi:hypothetical protein
MTWRGYSNRSLQDYRIAKKRACAASSRVLIIMRFDGLNYIDRQFHAMVEKERRLAWINPWMRCAVQKKDRNIVMDVTTV